MITDFLTGPIKGQLSLPSAASIEEVVPNFSDLVQGDETIGAILPLIQLAAPPPNTQAAYGRSAFPYTASDFSLENSLHQSDGLPAIPEKTDNTTSVTAPQILPLPFSDIQISHPVPSQTPVKSAIPAETRSDAAPKAVGLPVSVPVPFSAPVPNPAPSVPDNPLAALPVPPPVEFRTPKDTLVRSGATPEIVPHMATPVSTIVAPDRQSATPHFFSPMINPANEMKQPGFPADSVDEPTVAVPIKRDLPMPETEPKMIQPRRFIRSDSGPSTKLHPDLVREKPFVGIDAGHPSLQPEKVPPTGAKLNVARTHNTTMVDLELLPAQVQMPPVKHIPSEPIFPAAQQPSPMHENREKITVPLSVQTGLNPVQMNPVFSRLVLTDVSPDTGTTKPVLTPNTFERPKMTRTHSGYPDTTPIQQQPLQQQPELATELKMHPLPSHLAQPDETMALATVPFRETQPNASFSSTPVPVGSPLDQGARVAVAIAQAATALGHQPVELTLNPEELGRVRLTLQAGDGNMAVAIAVERPETLELLRRHIDLLAEQLRDIGYDDLVFSFSGDGGAQSDQDNDDDTTDHQPSSSTPNPGTSLTPIARISLSPENGIDIRL